MTRFSDLKLDPKVLKAIEEAGYDKPTPIQAGAIPPALEGRDVLGIAQTGTGKTAGFTLPVVTLLGRGRARARMPRSLVLCPTRELAAQVAEHFDLYAKYTRLTRALLIGGVSFGEQDKLIDRGVDVLIATPGRLLDHFERGKLLLTGVQIMVVDEADRMLDMGFIPDIERIFQLTPFTRQTLFFSATMAPEIERLTNTFLHAPERIEVARQATASETIEQRLVAFTPSRKDQTARQKRELLRCLIDAEGEALTNAMIFANRKTDVDIVAKSLKTHGYDAAPIHGDLNQGQRTRTLDDFREGRLRFLVASDVAARGLDIPAVSHVFNFDLPGHAEDYVHRIGRTGRAGREGIAISLTVPDDDKVLSAIENLLKQPLPRADLPEGFSTSGPRSSRSPSEGGSRRRRSDSRPAPEPAKAETARPQTAKPTAAEPGAASSRQGAAPDRAPQPRNTGDNHRGRGRQGRDDQHGRHDAITGMGGHVPEFLTRSFLDALAATARNDDLDDENDSTPDHEASAATPIVEAQAGTAAETAANDSKNTSEATETEPKPARSRRRRSTASKAAEPAEDTATQQDVAADMPAAETGTDDAPAPVEDEAEKPKTTTRRRSTTRRKATESKPDSQAETGATDDGNLTGATEAGQSAPDPEPVAEEVAPEKPAAPAPRSRARKTAAAKAEADTTTEADPAADPAPKAPARRATTRKATTTSTRKPAAAKAAKAGPAETPDAKADDAAAAAETDSAEASAATQKPAATTRSSTTKAKTTPASTAKKATTKTAATKATAAKTSAAKATTKAAAKPKAKPAATKAATDTTAAVEAPDAETGADDPGTA